MKPKKNRIYCPLANRAKMLFESKDEADTVEDLQKLAKEKWEERKRSMNG